MDEALRGSLAGIAQTMKGHKLRRTRFASAVGNAIRSAREARGMSQHEMGDKTGNHFSLISRYERGEVTLSAYAFLEICNALQLEAGTFFTQIITKEKLQCLR